MKIAIVAPQPSPYGPGGAENLFRGLRDSIIAETQHSCDIVALIAPEGDFWQLMSSYLAFARLDLSAYDIVISGKYPAWMVDHPDHRCYMLHRLRGLYDTYGQTLTVDLDALPQQIRAPLAWMRGVSPTAETAQALLESLLRLDPEFKSHAAFAFPGPLAREIVHFLDASALSTARITRYAAISSTVANRQDYFPADTLPRVLYPPPHRDDYHCGPAEYLFTSSRLDGAKRIDLLVKAMRRVKADIPLLIAGTGPDQQRLKELAGDDPRIQFLGFVADDDMPALYANALAVPFVPFDEDYGLVTIEAMRSGKPVLTVTDAGGPCEFVTDGRTGFAVPPSPEALAEKIDHLAANRAEAAQMGEIARQLVQPITWKNVIDGLLTDRPAIKTRHRPKITVAATFPVWPARGGGQARLQHLYRNLARNIDVELVTFAANGQPAAEIDIAPGLRETRLPKSEQHDAFELALARSVGELAIADVASIRLAQLTPDYRDALRYASIGSSAMVACHPYLVGELIAAAPRLPLWYEAQDVDYSLKKSLLGGRPGGERLLEDVWRVERQCWLESRVVYACTSRDLAELAGLFGPTNADKLEVPNGVALDQIAFTDLASRRKNQQIVGLDSTKSALFLGSWHGPNIDAADVVLDAARHLPDIAFLIAGSVCGALGKKSLPDNVRLLGIVDDETLNMLVATVDIALNPMRVGSGTNLKMLDYFAAGIPVVSTPFGARGLAVDPATDLILAEGSGFAEAIARLAGADRDRLSAMVRSARNLVEQRYSWSIIADQFYREIESLL